MLKNTIDGKHTSIVAQKSKDPVYRDRFLSADQIEAKTSPTRIDSFARIDIKKKQFLKDNYLKGIRYEWKKAEETEKMAKLKKFNGNECVYDEIGTFEANLKKHKNFHNSEFFPAINYVDPIEYTYEVGENVDKKKIIVRI